ncbi:hypothetical protein MJP36_04610 [Pseudomonas palleroniana]|uniref:hypothetical protein n=1 Tax=Pseudomonas palleroniana TaxID=191390 RepID=UPI001FCC1729|nr:hypothetical protein [Pseudomonas palleroniana]UOK39151.1 hypothetical protein MJP36_04610 [Pseudomonas palleroniana]
MNIAHASSLNNAFQLMARDTAVASAPGNAIYQGTQAQADAVAKQDTMVREYRQPLGGCPSDTPSAEEVGPAMRPTVNPLDIYKPMSDEEAMAWLKPAFIHPGKLTEKPASLGQAMLEIRSLLR